MPPEALAKGGCISRNQISSTPRAWNFAAFAANLSCLCHTNGRALTPGATTQEGKGETKQMLSLIFAFTVLTAGQGVDTSSSPAAPSPEIGRTSYPGALQFSQALSGVPPFVATIDCVFNVDGRIDTCTLVNETRTGAGALIIPLFKKYSHITMKNVSDSPAGVHKLFKYKWQG